MNLNEPAAAPINHGECACAICDPGDDVRHPTVPVATIESADWCDSQPGWTEAPF